MQVITSKSNKYYSKYKSLAQKKYREKYGLFIVEGYKMVKEALASAYEIERIITCEKLGHLTEFEDPMVLTEELFKDLSLMENPEGIMAVLKKPGGEMDNLSPRLICLDAIKDPGNMGTIIRSCDAFNFSDLVLMSGCVDPYNHKALRGSMGSIFRVNIHMANEDLIKDLVSQGYKIIASSLEDSREIKDLSLPEKYILVIGNESHGIGDFFKNISHSFVHIPMSQDLDSLNAAIAASIFMYEFSSR